MELGIAGRKAVICASSQGLGLACAKALAREGVHVFINGRTASKVESAAHELAQLPGGLVTPVVADISTEAGRNTLLHACPNPDILLTNNAGPAPGSMEDWSAEVWRQALENNMLSAVLLIQSVVRGMQQRKFGRIVNITSALVKSPRPHMALSTAARTGLTAFAKALSLDVAKDNVTINQLLPERIESPRQVQMTERYMKEHGIDWNEARNRITKGIAAGRFGTPEEFGDACAFLCSSQAGFISGQNLQLDGGSSPGLI